MLIDSWNLSTVKYTEILKDKRNKKREIITFLFGDLKEEDDRRFQHNVSEFV